MTGPRWLRKESVVALHDRSLALHGGPSGIRDEGLLESALRRPLNRYHYEGVEDICELAATYAVAIAGNHPFVDGNKRAAFAALLLFLVLNDRPLAADKPDAIRVMLAVASGEIDIARLAAWVRANSRPR